MPYLPSPEEIIARGTPCPAGGYSWKAKVLAEWGITWPPSKGWRYRLEQAWREQTPEGQAETRRNRIEQLQTEIEERQDLIAKLTTEMPTSASLQPAPE